MMEMFVTSCSQDESDASKLIKRTVRHDYHDHANDGPVLNQDIPVSTPTIDEEEEVKKRRGPRGGVAVPFPEKLHVMLSSVEHDGNSHIVSWQAHGRCFVVHKPKEFVSTVMPKYFRQTKLTSFQRQLNLYGFCRLTSGRDRGGYYHELFLRGRPFLCKRMMRTRIKGTGIKAASSPQTEPDFYVMPSVKDFSASSVSLDEAMTSQPPLTTSLDPPVQRLVSPPTHSEVPSLVPALVSPTPSMPTMVTPTHMPVASPQELPSEIMLEPNSVIAFEGQQFHYLDPAQFASSPSKPGEWPTADADYPLNDIVMV